jgi:hypothetical protein
MGIVGYLMVELILHECDHERISAHWNQNSCERRHKHHEKEIRFLMVESSLTHARECRDTLQRLRIYQRECARKTSRHRIKTE